MEGIASLACHSIVYLAPGFDSPSWSYLLYVHLVCAGNWAWQVGFYTEIPVLWSLYSVHSRPGEVACASHKHIFHWPFRNIQSCCADYSLLIFFLTTPWLWHEWQRGFVQHHVGCNLYRSLARADSVGDRNCLCKTGKTCCHESWSYNFAINTTVHVALILGKTHGRV